MKTLLIMVGKTVNKHFVAGINDYCERISHYMPFDTLVIPEIKNTRKLTEEQQKIVREAVPQKISEAEPKDVSKK